MRYLIILCLAFTLYSCGGSKKAEPGERLLTTDTSASYCCPFLTRDADGDVVMSWVKELNDSDAVLCYARLSEHGTFKTVRQVAASRGLNPHNENLPKIAFKKDGSMIAMWGIANPHPDSRFSGLVRYATSNDGKNWSAAIPLVADSTSYDQRYFDMVMLPDGEIAAVWLDSRLKAGREGSTLFFSKTDVQNRFREQLPIAESCCPCCRTDLYIDRQQHLHIAFRDIIQDSIRDMVHMVSKDAGMSFTAPVRIAADNWVIRGCPHTGPTMTENDAGLHFAWYTLGTGEGVFYTQTKDGTRFSMKENISANPSAKHPQILAVDDKLIIVWDESVRYDSATNNLIMMQIRDRDGKRIDHKHITPFSSVASFPVIAATSSGAIVIAYTMQNADKKQIRYRMINL